MKKGENIWLIGASTGIGKALAKELSDTGARLVLSSRNKDALEELEKILGGGHFVCPVDIADSTSVAKAVSFVTETLPRIDRVICLAAVYTPGAFADIPEKDMENIVNTNLAGTLRVAKSVLPVLEQQGGGQLVLCGSIAGYAGLPASQPYAATKAGIMNLAQSLYMEYRPKNIDIKLISPGFVKTPMTDKNDFPMPFIMQPEDAAKRIAKGLNKKSFEIHFPRRFTFLLKFLRLLPASLYFFIIRRLA